MFDIPPTATRRILLVAACCAATVAFFFRVQIASGFSLLNGDRYDGVIELAILEHWYNVFRGLEPFAGTFYFYPAEGALGYNDGYFLYALIYAPLRAAGADPFLAGELVHVALRTLCFVAVYAACRRILALSAPWSVFAAMLATLSHAMFVQALHGQLFAVGFAPVMALLADGVIAAFLARNPRGFLLWAGAAALLLGAWLLTAFYTAWFFLFFAGFAAAGFAVLAPPGTAARWKECARAQIAALLAAAGFFILALLPFLWVYLPKAAQTGQHSYADVFAYTPSPLDAVNLGSGNLLFGWLSGTSGWSEMTSGIPPVLLVVFACVTVWLWRGRKMGERTALVLAAAALASWLMTVHIGRFSLWAAIYDFVPGARAIRVVARYQLFLALPVAAIAALFLARHAARIGAPFLILICALLIGEEIDTKPPLRLDRAHELARLAAVPPAPSPCRAFFVSAARGEGLAGPYVDGIYSHNVDAMMIAETLRLPTPNGMATFAPPGWNLVDPAGSTYRANVRRWAAAHGIAGLCGLDLRAMRWNLSPFTQNGQTPYTPSSQKR